MIAPAKISWLAAIAAAFRQATRRGRGELLPARSVIVIS